MSDKQAEADILKAYDEAVGKLAHLAWVAKVSGIRESSDHLKRALDQLANAGTLQTQMLKPGLELAEKFIRELAEMAFQKAWTGK